MIIGEIKLDVRTEKFFELINELCKDGNYKVLEVAEVLEMLPKKYNFTFEDIQNMLKYLSERDYVDVKFVDEKSLCVASLPKGRLHLENQLKENKTAYAFRRLFIGSMIVSGLMAFLGAFVATLILK